MSRQTDACSSGSTSILCLRDGTPGEWTAVECSCQEECGHLQGEPLEKHPLYTEFLSF
jgi:hypothetical protein